MSQNKKIIVLGAGVAGLSCAHKLVKEGYTPVVIEKNDSIGGICRTVSFNDFKFDIGGHRFITDYSDVLKLVKEVVPKEELLSPDRKSVIRFRDAELGYPIQIKDIFSLDIKLKSKMIFDYLKECLLPVKRKEKNLAGWLIKRFGYTLYHTFFEEYSSKLWGRDAELISSDWASQRISGLNLSDVLLRILGVRKKFLKTYVDKFYYPKDGIGVVSDYIAKEIKDAGGQILCSLECKSIFLNKDNKISKVICMNKEGQEIVFETEDTLVFSSLPLPEMVNAIEGVDMPLDIVNAVSRFKFRALRTVNIMLDKARVSDNSWIYIQDKEYIFFRIQEPINWSPFMAPDGKTSLILEIACSQGDKVWKMSQDELIARTISDLEKLGYEIKDSVIDAFVVDEPHAYPVYHLGYKKELSSMIDYVFKIKNFMTFGRQGVFRYNNMDHSMKMGIIAASVLSEGNQKEAVLDVC